MAPEREAVLDRCQSDQRRPSLDVRGHFSGTRTGAVLGDGDKFVLSFIPTETEPFKREEKIGIPITTD